MLGNAPLPGLVETTRAGRKVQVTEFPRVPGPAVAVKSDQVDSGNSAIRTSLLRPGYVLVKVTSTGKYVAATDGTGDRCAAAYVVSSEAPDNDWQSQAITIVSHVGTITVTPDADDNTLAEVIAACEAVPEFDAHFTATDDGSGKLKITSRLVGAGAHLKVTSALSTAFGASGKFSVGTDADYLVSEDYVDMLNGAAVATEGMARTLRVAHFDAEKLINATAEAMAVLARRGSIFEGSATLAG